MRETIAFLADSLWDGFQQTTWAGVSHGAEELDPVFGYGFTTKPGGHGFGLHTCANHVAQVGGSIRAESSGPGRGATFSLRFRPAEEA